MSCIISVTLQVPLHGIGYFVHTACFCYREKTSALGRETEKIQTSAMSRCARREAGHLGKGSLGQG